MNSYISNFSDTRLLTLEFSRYLRRLIAISVATFLAAWALVALLPMAVLNIEYPVWMVKKQMAQSCDIGSVMVLGDSRAMIGIIPAVLGEGATNLALEGSTPLEAYYLAKWAMRCPHPPKQVIISFSLPQFFSGRLFWEHSVRYGFLSASELREIEARADQLHDTLLRDSPTRTGTSDLLATWLYYSRFPSAYFSGLANNGLTGYFRNKGTESQVLHDRGHWTNGGWEPGAPQPVDLRGEESSLQSFAPSPVIDDYFNRLLSMLLSRGVHVSFVMAPISETDFRSLHEGLLPQYAAYFDEYAKRYPQVRMAAYPLPHWADRYFLDSWQHMTQIGSTLFTEWLNTCLPDRSCAEFSLQSWPQQVRLTEQFTGQ